jgi:hypothetical protein
MKRGVEHYSRICSGGYLLGHKRLLQFAQCQKSQKDETSSDIRSFN